jgi:dolichol-phosphate mannosyltransferase
VKSTKTPPKIVIVIPTYNEIGHTKKMIDVVMGKVFPKIKNHQMMLLYVDSHSPDGTGSLIQQEAKKYPEKLFLLDEGGKYGLGMAYAHGFRFAIEKLHADGVMEMDSDFQHDPYDIPKFLAEFDRGYDYILGSRYISGGSIPKEWGFDRKLLSIAGNLTYKFGLLMFDIHDFTTGFRLARVKGFLEKMDFEKVFVKSFAYKTILLYEMKKRGAKVIEIPNKFGLRESGDSKMTTNTISESLKIIFLIWLRRLGIR